MQLGCYTELSTSSRRTAPRIPSSDHLDTYNEIGARATPQAPTAFQGSWTELYRDHLRAVLPTVAYVCQFHEWMGMILQRTGTRIPSTRGDWNSETAASFDRGSHSNRSCLQLASMDCARGPDRASAIVYQDFRDLILTMPTHIFDVRKCARQPPTISGGTSLTSCLRKWRHGLSVLGSS